MFRVFLLMIKLYDEKATLKNEMQWPKKYTRKFLEQGLVNYKDIGLDNLLLRKETIDSLIPSFIGKPVIIKHQEVSPENFLDVSVGNITDIYFNNSDGWFYVDFLITHDKGHEKMAQGWGVSCAYKVSQLNDGGEYHNIAYNGEIVAGTGEHLALVENPRYEDCLMVVNDKPALLYNEKTYLAKHNEKKPNVIKFFDDSKVIKIYEN